MLVKTKFFGEVDLPEEKIITFERGLIGLADYKKFTILYGHRRCDLRTEASAVQCKASVFWIP